MKNEFELVHVGINTPNAEEAEKLAQLLSMESKAARPPKFAP